MARITESVFIDRFLKRVCELHPNAEPTDLLEYAINNATYADTSPEQAAEIFAADIADHWLSIGRLPIPARRKRSGQSARRRQLAAEQDQSNAG